MMIYIAFISTFIIYKKRKYIKVFNKCASKLTLQSHMTISSHLHTNNRIDLNCRHYRYIVIIHVCSFCDGRIIPHHITIIMVTTMLLLGVYPSNHHSNKPQHVYYLHIYLHNRFIIFNRIAYRIDNILCTVKHYLI